MIRRVVCAAVRARCGRLICSPRHFDAIAQVAVEALWASDWAQAEQGFVDQCGTFMTREEAWPVAEAAGQIVRRVGGDGNRLYSENLY